MRVRSLAGRGRACTAGTSGRAQAGTGSVRLPCNILAARARERLRRRRDGRGAGERAVEAAPTGPAEARGVSAAPGSLSLARSLRFAGSGRDPPRREAVCRWRG